ncbi:hypothetical protein M6B38_207940 [Iris pallida]|uniref:Uncharacterized protein n=1 Tax=Iris pallida TaxID=29817 RepID=A0AAX6E630_IRIPA|nr:hypothetical protein M6B38_207930 [Iris pallida]KAJ6799411.1 hypothetical protein M6B38_207935 [Iris pallida]KAJ6799412.1 hypothetical protein M6B38_207940 [Iris pallida]
MRCTFRSCSLLTGDNILGNTEDDELYYNSYYDPVLFPATVPEPFPEDAEPGTLNQMLR